MIDVCFLPRIFIERFLNLECGERSKVGDNCHRFSSFGVGWGAAGPGPQLRGFQRWWYGQYFLRKLLLSLYLWLVCSPCCRGQRNKSTKLSHDLSHYFDPLLLQLWLLQVLVSLSTNFTPLCSPGGADNGGPCLSSVYTRGSASSRNLFRALAYVW